MAVDADNIIIAPDASVYVAPVGSTLPVDVATAMDAAFIDVGYTSDDGLTFDYDRSISDINVHQSLQPVRRVVEGITSDFGFVCRELNRETMALAFGGGTWTETGVAPDITYRYDLPDPSVIDERAICFEWADGPKKFRIFAPRAMVTSSISISLGRTAPVDLPITMSILATDGVSSFSFLSAADNFATA